MIVDPFAGPGGWSEGLRMLGLADIGIEWDAAACATRAVAGHATIRADVATYPPERFAGAEGAIFPPPCPDFSVAGKRAGRSGKSGHLIDTVPVWVEAIRPRWVACEQVPPCLPIWQEHAARYRQLGYSTWCGILNAADYGVPQTRHRAFLLASLDRPATPPEPTHCQGGAVTMFGALAPWVVMGEAPGLVTPVGKGWRVGFPRIDDRGDSPDGYRERDWRTVDQPSLVVTEKARSWVWQRPATTISGDSRCWPPGHKVNADDIARHGREQAMARYGDRAGTEAIRLPLGDALALQSFRSDYPVQGTKTKQFEQVGNAVPPLLAAHVIAAITGHALEAAA